MFIRPTNQIAMFYLMDYFLLSLMIVGIILDATRIMMSPRHQHYVDVPHTNLDSLKSFNVWFLVPGHADTGITSAYKKEDIHTSNWNNIWKYVTIMPSVNFIYILLLL